MPRPTTTLILPISADGKLVSRDAILTDHNPSWRTTPGVLGYLQQFFDFSGSGDYALTTGEVMALSGVNQKTGSPTRSHLSLVVLDFNRVLTKSGIAYLRRSVSKLVILRTPQSPTHILTYLARLKIARLTLHSTPMNASWLEHNLVDHLTLIIYPLVVGESGTPVTSLGLHSPRTLTLIETTTFDTNYICLRYNVNDAQ